MGNLSNINYQKKFGSKSSNNIQNDSKITEDNEAKIEKLINDSNGLNYSLSKINSKMALIDLKYIDDNEWQLYFDNNGCLSQYNKLVNDIYAFGLDFSTRKKAWMYLLQYYPFLSTFEERKEIDLNKKISYERMKLQWMSISEEQELNFTEYSIRKNIVEKDVSRTDKLLEFYKGENNKNSEKLKSILMTYCMFNFDLGYVQGMSDLLAPLLFLFHDEHITFWCFTYFMKINEGNFHIDQTHIPALISTLRILIQFLYPDLHKFFISNDSNSLNFVFSWLLINFKRQFSYHDIFILWDKYFTQKYTVNYSVFLAATIIGSEKDFIIQNQLNSDHILNYFNKIDHQLNVNMLIDKTEQLLKQLKSSKHLPPQVQELLL